jgi:phospholipid/cholesterol/gamma-HCH transport system substrate-binding protein
MSGTGRKPFVNPLIAGFVAGVVIAFVVGLMATINLTYGAPWASTHTVSAQVTDADSMAVGSDVRIAGRLVGQVTSITANGAYTTVTFHVDAGDWPLPADTTANVRLATLLGQKYIQLNPGQSTDMMADNYTIGVQATRPVVDFDQLLSSFDKQTRDSLTSLLRTVSAAVQGQEGTFQQLVPNLSDLSVNSQIPTGELVTRDPEINQILINLGITADQLNQSRDAFAGVITNLNTVSAALASNEGAAFQGYIQNTDTLNQTTHAVLASGNAAAFGAGLQQLGSFTNQLNTLLTSLIPQSRSFFSTPPGFNPATDGNKALGINTPAQASIDLIYEIGSATSQSNTSNSPGNYFLRQNVQGVDPCGLAFTLCGLPPPPKPPAAAATKAPASPLPTKPICIPLLTCITPPVVPLPPVPTVPPTPPPPTLIPLPTPSLGPITISDDVHFGDAAVWNALFRARYR